MGASSSSSEARAHSTVSSGAGSGSMCLAKSWSWEWSAAASVTASWKAPSLWVRKRRQSVDHAWFSQRSVTARDAHSAKDWRRRPSWRPGWPRWRGCWPCPNAEGDRERRGLLGVALQLGLYHAAAPGLMHLGGGTRSRRC